MFPNAHNLNFRPQSIVLAALLVIFSVGFVGCGSESEDADVIFERGVMSAERGDMESAVRFFSDALAKQGERADIVYERGRAYEALGFLEKAVEDYDVCLKQQPDFEGAINNKGVCMAKMQNHEAAIEQFSKLVELSSSNVLALRNRGLCYHDTQQFQLAKADYDAALDIDSEDPETWFQRGNVFLEQDQPELALKDFSEAVRIDDAFSKAWMNRGVALFGLGRPDEGMKDLLKARDLDDSIIIPDLDWVKLSQTTAIDLAPANDRGVQPENSRDKAAKAAGWQQMKSDGIAALTERKLQNVTVQTQAPKQLCGILRGEKNGQKLSVYVGVALAGRERVRISAASTAAGAKRSLLVLKWDDSKSKFLVDRFVEDWQPTAADISPATVEATLPVQ